MRLLVGLGNPGPGHARQRHNIGFLAADRIQERHGFTPWRLQSRFDAEISEGRIGDERVVALKPMTYMNNSGEAVAAAARSYGTSEPDLIVIYDEVELEPGKIRVKQGGGNAGHNGLKSIDALFGNNYWRVRLGVGRPDRALTGHDPEALSRWVLHNFAKDDVAWVTKLLDAVADNIPALVGGDAAGFMNKVTLATRPPRPKAEPAKDEH